MLPFIKHSIISALVLGVSLSSYATAATTAAKPGATAAKAAGTVAAPVEGMPAVDPKTPIYQVDVAKGVSLDDVRQSIEMASQERNMNIVGKLDIQEGMKGRGFEAKDTYLIYEVCNLGMGADIIKAAPEFGIFAPCKIVIYSRNGQLKLLTYRPTYALTHLKNYPEETRKVAQQIENDIIYVMSKAKDGSF